MSPISRSAGRFVGRFPIPKSLVSVMMVSVRGAFPYCLIVVCLSSTCRLGVTPAVITLVREPSRCRARAAADRTGVEDETDLIGAADVEVVADDLLEEDPTRDRCVEHLGQGELGPQDRQVVAAAAARSAAVNGCGESGFRLRGSASISDGPNPVADRLHRRGDGIVGFSPSPNSNGIRIWWREKNQNRSDGRKRPSGQSKPVCRPSAATIPTSGSTPSRRSPKPPESPPCFARLTGFRSVGRPRTDRTALPPHPRG